MEKLKKEPDVPSSLIYEEIGAAALTECLSFRAKLLHGSINEIRFKSYVQVENHLFENYPTYNIIPEVEAETLLFTQPTNIWPLQYGNTLWMKTLRRPIMYDKYVRHRTFVERPLSSSW